MIFLTLSDKWIQWHYMDFEAKQKDTITWIYKYKINFTLYLLWGTEHVRTFYYNNFQSKMGRIWDRVHYFMPGI